MPRQTQVLHLGQQPSFFESPRWRDGRWWISDFHGLAVFAVRPTGQAETILRVEEQPSGLGWLPDGSLLVVSMRDRRVLRRSPDGEVLMHADISAFCGGTANDMAVSADGYAYVANVGFSTSDPEVRPTRLIRIGLDGSADSVGDDVLLPNGIVITDEGTLIVAESLAQRFSAFDIEPDGTLSRRRVWAVFGPYPHPASYQETRAQLNVIPDGCTSDAAQHLWSADSKGGPCVRIAPSGEVVDEIPTPAGYRFSACMLGGADGRTLLLCANRGDHPHTQGMLLTTIVDIPHAGLP